MKECCQFFRGAVPICDECLQIMKAMAQITDADITRHARFQRIVARTAQITEGGGMTKGVRILLVCPGKPKRKFILTEPPFPEVGELVTHEGVEYRVWNVEPVEVQIIPRSAPEARP